MIATHRLRTLQDLDFTAKKKNEALINAFTQWQNEQIVLSYTNCNKKYVFNVIVFHIYFKAAPFINC